ncbi:electron transfer flavoprotein subunit alpha/FixB family protein [Enterococcus florum]|uniref:Electron transfer flavoprotein subunit alpha/FixB family protein n=1 Tax=Enterococcus florum TaxID=2480627 RepID=A0A4P5PF71_9ENTE|nr:electron transfer flavoprotein subunit alpha/FixB family protein [Enterococcus florum]GCF94878.1 electron transfer flavoprotein subunit alpha/FixB family protein [Enterococcus florum]
MFKTLILIDSEFMDYSLDLIEAADRLAGEEESVVYGLGINLPDKALKGLDYLICVDDPALQVKDSRVVTDIIERVYRNYQFDSLILLATDFGRMVAPRAAMRLKAGLVADITGIEVDRKGRQLIRPAFSGNILANIICDSEPIMASVHPKVFHAQTLTKEPEMIPFTLENLKASTIEILDSSENKTAIDIREADVLISAGAGYSAEMASLQELADKMDGSLAASKAVVEQQRAPREIQVGQSGKTVSPDLYLALGIYGSIQHVEGLKNVKDLISVNTDQKAPLNYLANLVVVGDAAEFVHKLTARLNQ